MMRWKTHRARILCQIRLPDGVLPVHEHPDQPQTARRVRQAPDLILRHANRDELLQVAFIIQHPHGSITCIHLFTGDRCDPFQ